MWFSFGAKDSNKQQARELVAGGATLLDVRTREEFASGHAHGAINIPVQELAQRVSELGDPTRHVVVYCRSGARSAAASGILKAAGYAVTDIGTQPRW
ncbi:MAG: rhodanese-like domain-containing protein [Polyangiales bacterium]